MTNTKVFGYKKQNDCQINYHPQNLHLVWEDDLYGLYFVRADNNKILSKSTDKMATVSTVETRTNANISRGFHDKTNHIIYLVDCDYDNTTSYVWSIDLSDDSITEITSKEGDIFDIWRYDSETYILYFENSGYTLEQGEIVPNGDGGTLEWNSTGANHYTEIDEAHATPNTADNIHTDTGADSGNQDDVLDMGDLDLSGYDSYNGGAGEQVYEIVCYLYCKGVYPIGVEGDQTGMSVEGVPCDDPTSYSWSGCAFSGLSLTNAELNALSLTLTGRTYEVIPGLLYYPDYIATMYCVVKFYGDNANSNVVIENLNTSDTWSNDMGANAGRSWSISQVTIRDDQFWFLFKWSNENCELWKFDLSDELFTEMEDCGSNTELPSIQQHAISYDNDDYFYFVLGVGTPEVSTIVADVPASIDDGDYITYSAIQRDEVSGEYSEIDYYIWFDKVGDESGDPAPASKTKITVDISGSANAQDVSNAIQSAVDDVVLITCANGGGTSTTCTLTCHHSGATTNIADVDSGLAVATTTPGVDNTYYLYTYGVTDDELTQKGGYDIALMLDRNTWTSVHDSSGNYRQECFRLEKGFGLTVGDNALEVYQIARARGNLYMIAQANRSIKISNPNSYIVAITDSYCIVNNNGTYELWEFVDLVANGQISEDIDIIHPEREYPDCVLQWAKKANKYFDPPTKDQWLQIYGRYTSNTITEAYYHDSAGFNEETPGAITSADDMDWLDSITLYDGSLTLGDYLNHKNCLCLQDDVDAGQDPRIQHTISQATAGIWEGYIGTSDVTADWRINFREGSTIIVYLRITTSKLYYRDDGDVFQEIQAVVNNTVYHVKVQWYADNTFDVSVNSVLEVDGANTTRDQTSGANDFLLYGAGDGTSYFYLDSPSLVGENYYYEGKNLIKYDDDVIIFEGLTEKHNRNILTDVKAISRATELDSISPKVSDYTDYTGKTSGQIVDQLIDDFCNYITPGTISNGSNTYTCPDDIEFKGDKTLRTIINELADGEYFTWALRPTGELDFDDGSVSSYVQILATHNSKLYNPYVTVLSEEYNQVIVYGRYISGAKVGPYIANNLASQQLHGILTWTKTYANQSDATILQAVADNKLLLQGNSPLVWEANREMGGIYEYGFIQPHETIYIEESVLVGDDTDETITASEAGWYHLSVNQYDALNDDSFLKLTDGLLFKENIQTTLPQQNSELIESLMGDGYATSQHYRSVPFWLEPSNGLTSGVNNTYWNSGTYMGFGHSSLTTGEQLNIHFKLPSDYVAGEDIILNFYWRINGSEDIVDYWIRLYYAGDTETWAIADTEDSTMTAAADANYMNLKTLTFDGTNLEADDACWFDFRMEDDNNVNTTQLAAIEILIPVNARS